MAKLTAVYDETSAAKLLTAIRANDIIVLAAPAAADEPDVVPCSKRLIGYSNWFELQFQSEKNLYVFNSVSGWSYGPIPVPTTPLSKYVLTNQGVQNAGAFIRVDDSGSAGPEQLEEVTGGDY